LISTPLILAAAVGSWGAQRTIRRRLSQSEARDRQALCEAFAANPAPRIPEVGLVSPYPSVRGAVDVRESTNHLDAATEFTLRESGLIISISAHACRPRAVSGGRVAEFNPVDGSALDACTSGGEIVIKRPESADHFTVFFKLLGAPPGFIQWNARQFIEHRDPGPTWEQALYELQAELQPQIRQEPVVAASGNVHSLGPDVATVDPDNQSMTLLKGPGTEMRRLFSLREAFQDFYREPGEDHARRVVGLIVDSLLESAKQRELSEEWRHELQNEPGAVHR